MQYVDAMAGRRKPRAARWVVRAVAALVVVATAIAGVALGLRVAGSVAKPTRLGTVSMRISPAAHGSVDAFIPVANWGVRAHAFQAPFELHVEPRSVDRQAVIAAAAGDTRVLASARTDASEAAKQALVRALVAAIAGAAAAGLVLGLLIAASRPRRRRLALGCFIACVLIGAAIAGTALLRARDTFDSTAFEAPSFYARGAELAQLLKVAEKAQSAERNYENSVDRTLSGYAALLRAGTRLTAARGTVPDVLMSDLHGNTLALDALKTVSRGAGTVYFVGDFGQSGTDAEANALVGPISRLGRRIVAVSGNHDSDLFMRRLASQGVIVLTQTGRLRADGSTDGKPVQRVGDVLVAGYEDPLESRGGRANDPKRIYSFSELPDGDAEFEKAATALVDWFRTLDPRPEIVLVHENGLAQALGAAVLKEGLGPVVVLTGHDHRQHVDIYGNTTVVDAGTVGAGGIFGAGRSPIGVAQLHFEPDIDELRAVDLLKFEPISGAASAARVVLGDAEVCDHDSVNCHDG